MNQMLREINHNGANCFWPLHQHSRQQTSTLEDWFQQGQKYDIFLNYPALDLDSLYICGHADASFGVNVDEFSQIGYCILFWTILTDLPSSSFGEGNVTEWRTLPWQLRLVHSQKLSTPLSSWSTALRICSSIRFVADAYRFETTICCHIALDTNERKAHTDRYRSVKAVVWKTRDFGPRTRCWTRYLVQMHIAKYSCKEYLYFNVIYNSLQRHLYFTHSMALLVHCCLVKSARRWQDHPAWRPDASCSVEYVTWHKNIWLLPSCRQNGVTVAAKMMTLTQDRAQQPLIWTSRSVLSCTRSAARCLIGFITWNWGIVNVPCTFE
jgi:hypothetical protein